MKYYIYYQGGKIYYSDSGSGDIIVLLHGYLESSDIWAGFANQLSKRFRIISIDLPGHGSSTIFSDCHTMDFMASAVNEALTDLNIREAFLIGHSLGGYVALAFLEKFPEKLTGYCLFHSHPFEDSPEIIKKREREIIIVKSGKKYLMYPENVSLMFASENIYKFTEALENSKEIASKIPDEGIISVLNGMISRPSRINLMEEGRVPSLWILGKNDNYIPCNKIQTMVNLPSNSKLIVLEKSGHLGFIEEEQRSVEIISDYVRGLRSQ